MNKEQEAGRLIEEAALEAIESFGHEFRFTLEGHALVGLIALAQLGLRHPVAGPRMMPRMKPVIEMLIDSFPDTMPAQKKLLRLGFDKEYDMPPTPPL